jgi:tetratricopeptide (TPR) repeat protein
VSIGLEFIHLSDEFKDMLAGTHDREFDPAMAGPDGALDLANVAGFALMPRLTDMHRLAVLVDACVQVEPGDVRRLLWFVGGLESTAMVAFDHVWLAEFQNPKPDWMACRSVIQRAYALARRCELPGLAQGAARVIARITDENLGDAEEALRLMDAMVAEIGHSPGQDDQRATTLLRKGDVGNALNIWRELLPNWQPRSEFDLQPPFSQRLAAVAAARLNEWAEAAEWFRRARAHADQSDDQRNFPAGLLVDEAYAHWKGGDNHAALDCLVEGFTAIDQLPPR